MRKGVSAEQFTKGGIAFEDQHLTQVLDAAQGAHHQHGEEKGDIIRSVFAPGDGQTTFQDILDPKLLGKATQVHQAGITRELVIRKFYPKRFHLKSASKLIAWRHITL